MIQMFQQYIFRLANTRRFFYKQLFIKQVADLEADLCVFIREKRRNARFGRTKRFAAQPFFFVLIEQHMVRHHDLRPVRHEDVRLWHSLVGNGLDLLKQPVNIQCYAVSDNTCSMVIKYTRRKRMQ